MAGPGGRIAPDGRPPRAKGVGKNARRHDLEAPATPGLHGSDLQQGDVQMMEQGQRVAPRPKRQQAAAGPAPRQLSRQPNPAGGSMDVPDPIQFAAGKLGGKVPTPDGGARKVDPAPWLPFIRELAMRPNTGGALAANYAQMLKRFRAAPQVTQAHFIDMDALDQTISKGL